MIQEELTKIRHNQTRIVSLLERINFSIGSINDKQILLEKEIKELKIKILLLNRKRLIDFIYTH